MIRSLTPQPRDAGFSLRYIKLTAGHVLPCGSASRDCKEFCLFFDSLANPAAPIRGIYASLRQADCGECARCAVQNEHDGCPIQK